FTVTGFVLVLVAAGLLSFAAHTAHEAGWLNSLQGEVVNLSTIVKPGTVQSALVTGVLGIQPRPTQAESLAWLLYLIPMGAFVLWPKKASPRPVQTSAAVA